MATAVFGYDAVKCPQSRDRHLGAFVDWVEFRFGDHGTIAEQIDPSRGRDAEGQRSRAGAGYRWVVGARGLCQIELCRCGYAIYRRATLGGSEFID
jgi:hypothetical protein